MVGESRGSVIWRNCAQRPAPSIAAASYSLAGDAAQTGQEDHRVEADEGPDAVDHDDDQRQAWPGQPRPAGPLAPIIIWKMPLRLVRARLRSPPSAVDHALMGAEGRLEKIILKTAAVPTKGAM